MSIPRKPLGDTGLDVSLLGYGASPLGAVYDQNFDPDEGIRSVHEAFRLGVNYFDTSPYYGMGQSEEVLGKALKTLPRSEIVLATKVGRYGREEFDFSYDTVTASIHQSLQRLQVDYIDIIQCHDIEFVHMDQVINEAIPALVKAKETGLVKHIGITGLPLKIFSGILDQVESGTVQTILSYCRHTLLDVTLSQQFDYLQSKGVGIINASPLSMGLLSPYGPPPWHPAPPSVKDACQAARDLCEAKGVRLPKIALFTALQSPEICTTVVGMPSIEVVQENVETAKLASLSAEEAACLKEVRAILEPVHNVTWPSGLPENN